MDNDKKMKVILYALSTCIWCKKTKKLLDEMGVQYMAIDVDLLDGEEKSKVKLEISKFNKEGGYPTLVVNEEKVCVGFDEVKIKEILK